MQADDDKAVDLEARGWTAVDAEFMKPAVFHDSFRRTDDPVIAMGVPHALAIEHYVDLRVREAAERVIEHLRVCSATGAHEGGALGFNRQLVDEIRERANGG